MVPLVAALFFGVACLGFGVLLGAHLEERDSRPEGFIGFSLDEESV